MPGSLNQTIDLRVRNRENLIFSGSVLSVTSFNVSGRFDILPNHANFISLIDKFLMYKELNGNQRELEIKNGLMRVIEGKVDVFLGIKKE